MINKRRLIKRFIKYVKISSLSGHEGRFAALIKKELKALGLKVKVDSAGKKIQGESGNIIAHFKGTLKRAPRIFFNAHLDTVVPGENIRPKIKGGVITSSGDTILGADNKAGVAVIMEALQTIKEKIIPHGEIVIAFTVAEEMGLCGAKFIKKRTINSDLGFVLDGGDIDEIINKAPSQDSITAKIIGRAAHAGVHPEQGINAIKVVSEAIAKMKIGRIDKETTSNIGIIKGGSATNIVPEEVEIKGEARSHNRKKLERQVSHMRKALISACRKNKAKLKLEIYPAYRAFMIPENKKVMVLAKKAMTMTKIKPKVKPTGGGSDANIFNSFGIPSIILGVGGDKVHTKKENIRITDMVKGVELVLNIIKAAQNA